MPTTAKPANKPRPKVFGATESPKSEVKIEPKVETKVDVKKKQSDQAAQERAERRVLDGADKRAKDGSHPFGRRNQCLIEARKAYRAGDMMKGDSKAREAGNIAALSNAEKRQLARVAAKGMVKS